jgi:hypothetical protein
MSFRRELQAAERRARSAPRARGPYGFRGPVGGGMWGGGASGPAPTLLNVSNRARVPTIAAGSTGTWGAVSYHNLFCGTGRQLNTLQVVWANWVQFNTGTGGTQLIKNWIEYPVGASPRQLATFGGGNPSVVAADAATVTTDVMTLNTPIPNGAKVGIWAEIVPSAAINVSIVQGKSLAFGDSMNVGTGGMSATSAKPADSGGGFIGPLAILGQSTAQSIFAAGDSRIAGAGATAGADGLSGEIEQTFGSRYAVMNMGISGALGSQFVVSPAFWLAAAAWTNYLIYEFGINDVATIFTGAQAYATASTAKALAWPAGMRKTILTLPPVSTGAWTLANGSDQTTATYNAQRVAYNALVLANAAGWDALYDFAPVNELAPVPTGKWKADGNPGTYTTDGVHETLFANSNYPTAFPTLL